MRAFVSDLDNTLIFQSHVLQHQHFEEHELQVAERKNGKNLSYMSSNVLKALCSIKNTKGHLFIPATSRSIEHYLHVYPIQSFVHPQYAIVSNGGNILVDGKIDINWQKHILSQIRKSSASTKEATDWLLKIVPKDHIKAYTIVDDAFCCFFLPDGYKLELDLHKHICNGAQQLGYNAFWHASKIYLIPQQLDKQKAVEYLRNKFDIEFVLVAGDSFLDLNMLNNADKVIVPAHGEIAKQQFSTNVQITRNYYLHASIEIAEKAVCSLWQLND